MFLKITTVKGKKYVFIAHSYRENGKIKHKHIASLGNLETLKKSGQLKELAKKLNELADS